MSVARTDVWPILQPAPPASPVRSRTACGPEPAGAGLRLVRPACAATTRSHWLTASTSIVVCRVFIVCVCVIRVSAEGRARSAERPPSQHRHLTFHSSVVKVRRRARTERTLSHGPSFVVPVARRRLPVSSQGSAEGSPATRVVVSRSSLWALPRVSHRLPPAPGSAPRGGDPVHLGLVKITACASPCQIRERCPIGASRSVLAGKSYPVGTLSVKSGSVPPSPGVPSGLDWEILSGPGSGVKGFTSTWMVKDQVS